MKDQMYSFLLELSFDHEPIHVHAVNRKTACKKFADYPRLKQYFAKPLCPIHKRHKEAFGEEAQ